MRARLLCRTFANMCARAFALTDRGGLPAYADCAGASASRRYMLHLGFERHEARSRELVRSGSEEAGRRWSGPIGRSFLH